MHIWGCFLSMLYYPRLIKNTHKPYGLRRMPPLHGFCLFVCFDRPPGLYLLLNESASKLALRSIADKAVDSIYSYKLQHNEMLPYIKRRIFRNGKSF